MPYEDEEDISVQARYDKTYAEMVGVEQDYFELPDPKELAVQRADDPTSPTSPNDPPVPVRRRRGPVLNESQQMQIAIWLVEGWSYNEAQKFMTQRWGFTVTESAWRYYKIARRDLTKQAAQFLDDHNSRFGYQTKAVRKAKLAAHLARLEKIIQENGLFEAEVHLVYAGRGKPQSYVAKKFSTALSKEYANTLKMYEDLYGKIETAIDKGLGRTMTVQIDDETRDRLIAAAKWRSGGAEADNEEEG